MKIAVIGLGYVGLSVAALLSQNNEVIGVDNNSERVDAVNSRIAPIGDNSLPLFLREKDLNLTASTNLKTAINNAEFVVISTPTNYDESTNKFDTSSVESIISIVRQYSKNSNIIIKSTIPIGFVDEMRKKYRFESIIFSPEFLREGCALHDNLYPSRIVVGACSVPAQKFAELLSEAAISEDICVLFTGTREAECIKLFSNTYLAMRVAYFNELDSYALANELNAKEIIEGVSQDPRIGDYYNNPSFGYGGYCLPKDSKQLLANYHQIPQTLISAVVRANSIRQNFLVDEILKHRPMKVGIYRLAMKMGSDNFRESSVLEIIKILTEKGISTLLFEPGLVNITNQKIIIENDLEQFKKSSDIILANRLDDTLNDVREKVFTRDIYGRD